MEKIAPADVLDLTAYEKVRDAMRARVIERKRHRRIAVGDNLEIPELVRMSPDEVRRTVNRFQGLDRDGVWLVLGGHRIAARFEEGHSKEEKMAAVHYVRFPVPEATRAALRDPASPARIVVDHPNYRAEAFVPPPAREELIADLGH